MNTSVMWFRRDLRLADSPALRAAVDAGDTGVVPLFVLDPALWQPAGPTRKAYLSASLRDLGERIGGLQLRAGDPVQEVLGVARAAGADTVHVSADFGPHGRDRDVRVEAALAERGISLVRTGSAYAVSPGRVAKPDGSPYRVYTPFARAWAEHGWPQAPHAPIDVPWIRPLDSVALPHAEPPAGLDLPPAGEGAAREAWTSWLETGLTGYAANRDRPDLDATSRMSRHLKWGEVHPRTLLADLPDDGKDAQVYRRELAWREFYADVLLRRPDTAREHYRSEYSRMRFDTPGRELDAWSEGRTGFPIVDAGMRQLRTEGWMHNRVRMLVASFLVKDLHLPWQVGGRHFMHWLVDADLASNMHGWQWTAGSGTDAAPYFRVFNPVTQGKRFDPDGRYIRRYVPELAGVSGSAVHEPWTLGVNAPAGYPTPIVDHLQERREALDRYAAVDG